MLSAEHVELIIDRLLEDQEFVDGLVELLAGLFSVVARLELDLGLEEYQDANGKTSSGETP